VIAVTVVGRLHPLPVVYGRSGVRINESGWPDVLHGDWEDLAKIRALLEAGADPDGSVWGYRRPLHVAAEEGCPEVVAELAGRVADIDAEEEGRSALWTAVYHGHLDNARALAGAGADPWRPMMAGWSPGRLSLAGPAPDLFAVPEGEEGLSDEEAAMAVTAPRLTDIFEGLYLEGLGLACVADVSAAEAAQRLGATRLPASEKAHFDELLWPENDDEGIEIIGATDVPGGCVITQPWGYAPQMPGVMALLSAGTIAHGLYANPKSGDQGCIFRDGHPERNDLCPGIPPYDDATSREILVGYLTRRDPVAYCCAYVGLRLPDARPVEGPPDMWLRLPERDWWA
jgi:Ankyrin repeats (3 copies)